MRALLRPCPAALSYTITLATGAWRPGQARWRRRRQLLQGVVHAATFATITIRFRATWPAFALSAFAGLTLGRTASALAWLGVQRIVPKTICDLVNKHADEGMFAGRLAACSLVRIAAACCRSAIGAATSVCIQPGCS